MVLRLLFCLRHGERWSSRADSKKLTTSGGLDDAPFSMADDDEEVSAQHKAKLDASIRARSAVPLSLMDVKKGPTNAQTLATSVDMAVNDLAFPDKLPARLIVARSSAKSFTANG